MKIVLEGVFEISDETGQTVKAGKGDVFFFPKGAKITFRTEVGALAWYCGQRKSRLGFCFLVFLFGRFIEGGEGKVGGGKGLSFFGLWIE